MVLLVLSLGSSYRNILICNFVLKNRLPASRQDWFCSSRTEPEPLPGSGCDVGPILSNIASVPERLKTVCRLNQAGHHGDRSVINTSSALSVFPEPNGGFMPSKRLYLSWRAPWPSSSPPPLGSSSSPGTWPPGGALPGIQPPARRPGTEPRPGAGFPQTQAPPPTCPASARPRPPAAPPSSRSAAATSGPPMRAQRNLAGSESRAGDVRRIAVRRCSSRTKSVYLESAWPSQSEPAAPGSEGHRGSGGSAGCRRRSSRPDWLPAGRALSAANGRSACSLKQTDGTVRLGILGGLGASRGNVGELTGAERQAERSFTAGSPACLHPPPVLLPASSDPVQTHP